MNFLNLVVSNMKTANLFTGLGMFDKAADKAGLDTLFQCEYNETCQTVLKHFYPNAELFTDIRTSDFTKYKGKVDILTGSPPCVAFSIAGKNLGADDERNYFDETFRAIKEIEPTYGIFENVKNLLSKRHEGVFEKFCSDCESIGYTTLSFVIPACAVNAIHKRERVWIIIYKNHCGIEHNDMINIDIDFPKYPTYNPVFEKEDFDDSFNIPLNKWRIETTKMCGNSILHQIPLMLFKSIYEAENLTVSYSYKNVPANHFFPKQSEKVLDDFYEIDKTDRTIILAECIIAQLWFSEYAELEWKLKKTKSGRYYFQLNSKNVSGLINTPAYSDYKGGCIRTDEKFQNTCLQYYIHGKYGKGKKTTYLNPLFTAEMMSIPVEVIVEPFLKKII